MKSVKELKEQLTKTDEEARQVESQIRSAHAQLVNATRDGMGGLDGLANAETILKARGEALQQIRTETLAELQEAEKEANSKASAARNKAIAAVTADLETAADDAGRALAALEAIVFSAIDEKHSELARLVNSDPNLTAQQGAKIARGGKGFRYLYELYLLLKRDEARRAQVENFERRAAAQAAAAGR